MNYLQLVGRLRRKCGVSGDNPTSFDGQPEEINRLIDWINEAWVDIQLSKPDWLWMRQPFTLNTVNGQLYYDAATDAALTDFGSWVRDSMRVYVTAVGTNSETELAYTDYENWRATYLFGANRQTFTRPNEVTITPSKDLAFGPIAASGFTITGEYQQIPTEMSLVTDIPALPSQFHMAIVYRAMMFYGSFEAASEVYAEGQDEFNKMMNRLRVSRLPEIHGPGPI